MLKAVSLTDYKPHLLEFNLKCRSSMSREVNKYNIFYLKIQASEKLNNFPELEKGVKKGFLSNLSLGSIFEVHGRCFLWSASL